MSRPTRPGMNTQNRENTHKSIEIGNRKSHQPHVPANTPGHERTQHTTHHKSIHRCSILTHTHKTTAYRKERGHTGMNEQARGR